MIVYLMRVTFNLLLNGNLFTSYIISIYERLIFHSNNEQFMIAHNDFFLIFSLSFFSVVYYIRNLYYVCESIHVFSVKIESTLMK